MGIVASLASVTVIVVNDCFSRQKFQALAFFLAGLFCVMCSVFQAAIPEQTMLIVSFGILAKFAAQSESSIESPISSSQFSGRHNDISFHS